MLYFRRNPGKTLPVVFVITVAVALVASVVTLVASIDLTVLTMYGYNRYFTVITPRNALAVSDEVDSTIRAEPLTAKVYTGKPAFTFVKTIFGKMPFVVFGLEREARDTLLNRCGIRLVSGRLPEEGKPEVALSSEIARNRRLKIGDVVMKPEIEDSYAIVPVKLVGILEGPVWLALTTRSFVENNFPVSPAGRIVLAESLEQQGPMDRALEKTVDKARARVWTYHGLVRETRDALSSLYLIMNVVIGIVVFSIAFLVGMLSSIYFTQRLPEFATLAAIGYQRTGLLLRILGEISLLCALGWALGSVLCFAVLTVIKAWVMHPRGLLLNATDWTAYRYTLPLPIAIVGFSILAIWNRLRTLDPVSIIERRQ